MNRWILGMIGSSILFVICVYGAYRGLNMDTAFLFLVGSIGAFFSGIFFSIFYEENDSLRDSNDDEFYKAYTKNKPIK